MSSTQEAGSNITCLHTTRAESYILDMTKNINVSEQYLSSVYSDEYSLIPGRCLLIISNVLPLKHFFVLQQTTYFVTIYFIYDTKTHENEMKRIEKQFFFGDSHLY